MFLCFAFLSWDTEAGHLSDKMLLNFVVWLQDKLINPSIILISAGLNLQLNVGLEDEEGINSDEREARWSNRIVSSRSGVCVARSCVKKLWLICLKMNLRSNNCSWQSANRATRLQISFVSPFKVLSSPPPPFFAFRFSFHVVSPPRTQSVDWNTTETFAAVERFQSPKWIKTKRYIFLISLSL